MSARLSGILVAPGLVLGLQGRGARPRAVAHRAGPLRAGDAESDRADFEAKAYGDNESISRKGPGKPGGFRASGS